MDGGRLLAEWLRVELREMGGGELLGELSGEFRNGLLDVLRRVEMRCCGLRSLRNSDEL